MGPARLTSSAGALDVRGWPSTPSGARNHASKLCHVQQLSEGMEIPAELASRFKFARQKAKLAVTICGSYVAFKNE
jgi:hypothetical protein